MSSIPLIVIVGPTASGKSALAIELALALDGEVVSADSRQVYTGLTIGTGKVTPDETRGVPHHLIDVAEPSTQYTVTEYVRDAQAAIKKIHARGKLPIICGGTGLYIDTLIDGIEIPEVPPNDALRKELSIKTTDELYTMLLEKDPARAASIDRYNPRRLVRALEIAEALGKVPAFSKKGSEFQPTFIGIAIEHDDLKKRIEKRLDERLDAGMIKEVAVLQKEGISWERLRSFGLEYRAIANHLEGRTDREEMRATLLAEIVAYARRQMTWFRRNDRIVWVKSADEALRVAKEAGL